ncbi:hypothetical protein [Haloferula sp. A504]|uniref:hypothetical protein n=1 Tax=Haloferula sp. A504 TaxID=3373601 RepID=UPI0031C96826|nr:hypothetical protein [Verrucomicrobiaceae bacterium E54]
MTDNNAFPFRVPAPLLAYWKSSAREAYMSLTAWMIARLDRAAQDQLDGRTVRLPRRANRDTDHALELLQLEISEPRSRRWQLAAISGPQPRTLEDWALDCLAADIETIRADQAPSNVIAFAAKLAFERTPDGSELVKVPIPADVRRLLDGARWRHTLDQDVWLGYVAYDLEKVRQGGSKSWGCLFRRWKAHRQFIDFAGQQLAPIELRLPRGGARRFEILAKAARTTPIRLLQGSIMNRYHQSALSAPSTGTDGRSHK